MKGCDQVVNEIELIVIHVPGHNERGRSPTFIVHLLGMSERNQGVSLTVHEKSRAPHPLYSIYVSESITNHVGQETTRLLLNYIPDAFKR